ncbi:MAG: LysM peptidoglycan-binding domain-containing protein [Phycisphaerales bacterium]
MTKETKIGLLVGLGVIIFIGILISDHLSVAQQQQPADLTRFDGLAGQPQSNNTSTTWGRRDTPLPPDQNEQLAVIPADGAGQFPPAGNHAVGPLNRVGEDFHVDVLEHSTGRADISPQPGDGRVEVIGNPPGNNANNHDKIHFIEKGDSLYSLAKKYYGDGSYYKTIYEANKDKMRSPGDLRIGVRLVIPDRGGNTTTSTPGSSPDTIAAFDPNTPPSLRGDRTPPTEPPATAFTSEGATSGGDTKTYTIQKGDVLGKLATKFYGTSKAWPKLVALNRGVIKDPDNLVVGTTIKVPK